MKTIIAIIFLATPFSANAQVEATNKTNVYQTFAGEFLKNCEGTDKKIAVAGFAYSDGRVNSIK